MKNATRITLFYLTLPFILFCLGWLRLSIAIPVIAISLWAVWQLVKHNPDTQFQKPDSRFPYSLYLITGIWVFLSGVGGYAFQNWDHHWRNAVLRDLISYDWSVIYSSPAKGAIQMLVYYVGYWLPAAGMGKLFGWQVANFVLFLWTWLGVFLVVVHLNLGLKTSAVKAALLLILFSGLDALGTLLIPGEYPTLLPAIQHLEIWSGDLQYSSFTTQLFWVFNQAVPAWLCIVLVLGSENSQPGTCSLNPKVFIWSLCFFFAPLAALGLIPYLLMDWLKQTDFKSPFKHLHPGLLLASGIVVLISFLYFSSNTAAREVGVRAPALQNFLVFFLLEGGILWLLLAPFKWHDPRWALTGLLLAVMPFIQIGSGRDFVMRASIAPLFHLMIMTGESIFHKAVPRSLLYPIYLLLFIGSLTPLYEINRSIQRTYEYYSLDDSQRAQPAAGGITHLAQPGAPETEHPNMLVADEIQTLKFMDDKLSRNFIANVRQSLYYRYISSR